MTPGTKAEWQTQSPARLQGSQWAASQRSSDQRGSPRAQATGCDSLSNRQASASPFWGIKEKRVLLCHFLL